MLILASSSPRRKELLGLITPDFTVCAADIDERALSAPTPRALAELLGRAKCAAVAQDRPADTIIGCDTVVDVDGQVLGKPRDKEDARRMIGLLSGRTHLVHTGVCIRQGGRERAFTDTTRVTFAPLSAAEIEAYIATPDPYDKAGAYGVQSGAAKFVQGIEGCYFNVMGFPVPRVYAALKQLDAWG